MKSVLFESRSETETDRLGAVLATVLPDDINIVIGLNGTLGAGKTRLVQAVAGAAGIDRKDVTSPTFVLCQQYYGKRMIFHLDAYRIRDDDEFLELGVDEIFAVPALVFVEWADRVKNCLPPTRVDVTVSLTPDDNRLFEIVDRQSASSKLLSSIERSLASEQREDREK